MESNLLNQSSPIPMPIPSKNKSAIAYHKIADLKLKDKTMKFKKKTENNLLVLGVGKYIQ